MKYEQILEKIAFASQNSPFHQNIRLVAVSKYVDCDEVRNLALQGQSEFGENKVQELENKCKNLSNLHLSWHFIGNLQTNKINKLISLRPKLWQSCNSLKLAYEVDKRLNYTLDTLLEINSADECSKNGVDLNLAKQTYAQIQSECKNINLCGVMSIGAHCDDEKYIAKSFEKTYKIFDDLKSNGATICSMGMSGDFELAIKFGANMIRLGSILFKQKN